MQCLNSRSSICADVSWVSQCEGKARDTLHNFSNRIRSLHVTLRHGSNELGYDMCVDCTMSIPIDSYTTTHVTIEEYILHALVVNKKSMINHSLAVGGFMCAEKSASGEKGRHKARKTHCTIFSCPRRKTGIVKQSQTFLMGHDCFTMQIFQPS